MTKTLRGDHCRCRTCGEDFNSTFAFDKHRVGVMNQTPPDFGRRCLTPDEMRAKGMDVNGKGWWISSRSTLVRDSVGRVQPDTL